MSNYTPEQIERRARHFDNAGIMDVAAMLRDYAATLRQQAARVDEDVRDRVAKAIADVIGHGMREKCYPHADAALEAALSAQPAEPVLDADARIGNMVFRKGVRWSTVIGAAQRQFKYHEAQPAERQGECAGYITADNLALLKRDDGLAFGHMTAPIYSRARSEREIPLYTHPAAPVGVPDGMVLVRKASLSYWQRELNGARQGDNAQQRAELVHSGLAAYLAAAPSAPQGEG